jgi:hypothetical protein
MAARVVILLPLLVYFTYDSGAKGAAAAVLVATFVAMPISYIVMFRTLRLRFREFLGVVWRPLASAVVLASAILLQLRFWPVDTTDLGLTVVRLSMIVVGGAALYFGLVGSLWSLSGKPLGAEAIALGKIRDFNERRNAS